MRQITCTVYIYAMSFISNLYSRVSPISNVNATVLKSNKFSKRNSAWYQITDYRIQFNFPGAYSVTHV